MNIPPRVKITSKVAYTVVWVSEFEDETLVGQCDLDNKQILLKMGESDDETSWTFGHEILHAISHEYGLDLTERQVSGVERALMKVTKLNRWLK